MTGQIKRLVRDRGFGFILSENGTEYFFHSSGLQNAQYDALQEGDHVVFEPVVNPQKGPRAEDIHVQ
jgi:CspA family cold shock protein